MTPKFDKFIQILFENPDSIRLRDDPQSSLSYERAKGYAFIFIEVPDGTCKFLYRNENLHKQAGHYFIDMALSQYASDSNPDIETLSEIESEIPKDSLSEIYHSSKTHSGRIFPSEKICSIWNKYDPKFIPCLERLFAKLRLDIKEYIFEFSNSTYKSRGRDKFCYSYEGLKTDTPLPQMEHDDDETKKLERQEQENRLLLAKIKMGEKPTLHKRITRDGD